MIVKCINNENVEGNLKLNVEYPVVEEQEKMFVVELKKGTKATYKKERFERVED